MEKMSLEDATLLTAAGKFTAAPLTGCRSSGNVRVM